MLSEARQTEVLAQATTGPQRSRMVDLIAKGKDVYAHRRQGKGVIGSFRRYVATKDPDKIDEGLYHFSTMGAGGLNDIAHFNIDGFRAEYPHPALYLERLLYPELNRGWGPIAADPEGYHSLYVYTDGLTSGDVRVAIKATADMYREALLRDLTEQRRRAEESDLKSLAARLGYSVAPIEDPDA